jgi:outer membrane lipase/esterase
MKRVLTPLAAACLLACLPIQANAAAYSGMVVFGDSLSDAGTFPSGTNPIRFTTQTGPGYAYDGTERFGNTSPMFINDMLGFSAQTAALSPLRPAMGLADGNNWAVGGFTTQQILDSITQPGGALVEIDVEVEVAPGVFIEVPYTLRQRDGYLADGRRVDPNTLFYVNGGGNDFLQGLVYSVPTAEAAAVRLGDSLRALQSAGARYIMTPFLVDVLSPATGALPPVVQDMQAEWAAAFNAELKRQMASVNANVIPLNVPLLYREVLANPGAYGFDASQDLLGTCFYTETITGATGCSNATWGDQGATPDPSKLIYADSVHPTTAMQRILAGQALSILSAPWEISLLPEMADGSLRAANDALRTQLQAEWGDWQQTGTWRGFVSGAGQHRNFDKADTSASGTGHGYSVHLGGSYRLSDVWRVGLAASLQHQELKLGAEDSEYKLLSYLGTGFAQYHDGLVWFDGNLTAGYLDYDLDRRFAMGITTRTESGDTDGYVAAIGGRLGVELGVADEALKISPFISADYSRVQVKGYEESGASSTALSFDRQTRESQRLGLGVQARYQFTEATSLFGEITREKEFKDDTAEIGMELNSVRGVGFELEGYSPENSLTRFSLGAQHQLAPNLALRAGYTYRHQANDNQHGANLSVVFDW